jgi:hypothetical protein
MTFAGQRCKYLIETRQEIELTPYNPEFSGRMEWRLPSG